MNMQTTITCEEVPLDRQRAPGAPEVERVVNVTVVYEDAATHKWAREASDEMFAEAGRETVHSTWWKLNELSDPAVLAGAVSKAMRADVIVVAIRLSEGFPLPFYVWVGSWLPHRPQGVGKLLALISTSPKTSLHTKRVVEYLRAVARRAQMPCQIKERNSVFEASYAAQAVRPRRSPTLVSAPHRTSSSLNRYASRRWRLAA